MISKKVLLEYIRLWEIYLNNPKIIFKEEELKIINLVNKKRSENKRLANLLTALIEKENKVVALGEYIKTLPLVPFDELADYALEIKCLDDEKYYKLLFLIKNSNKLNIVYFDLFNIIGIDELNKKYEVIVNELKEYEIKEIINEQKLPLKEEEEITDDNGGFINSIEFLLVIGIFVTIITVLMIWFKL